jgi:hypothetical protein
MLASSAATSRWTVPGPPCPGDVRFQGFRDARIQRFRDSEIQRFRDSEIQRFRDSGIHRFRDSGIPTFSGRRSGMVSLSLTSPSPSSRISSSLQSSAPGREI